MGAVPAARRRAGGTRPDCRLGRAIRPWANPLKSMPTRGFEGDRLMALGGDLVELTVPAPIPYLAVVRTATAGLAARLGFTLDEIEDLRIAVDEACSMLLGLPPAA